MLIRCCVRARVRACVCVRALVHVQLHICMYDYCIILYIYAGAVCAYMCGYVCANVYERTCTRMYMRMCVQVD